MVVTQKIMPENLIKLEKVFKANKWEIGIEYYENVFNKYCEMFSYLDKKQQDLILELTKKFLKINLAESLSYLKKALTNIPKQPKTIKKYFIIPLLTNEDRFKQKSSHLITSILEGLEIDTSSILGVDKVIFPKQKNWLLQIASRNDGKLLLVDDFIGTGKTVETGVKELSDEINIDKEKIIVLVLIAQEEGYKKLLSKGITVVCSELRKKGISDEYQDPTRSEYINLMKSIENLLKIQRGYHFGYKCSEALVSLNKTPNNTFPVFWQEKKRNNEEWPAPFPRR